MLINKIKKTIQQFLGIIFGKILIYFKIKTIFCLCTRIINESLCKFAKNKLTIL